MDTLCLQGTISLSLAVRKPRLRKRKGFAQGCTVSQGNEVKRGEGVANRGEPMGAVSGLSPSRVSPSSHRSCLLALHEGLKGLCHPFAAFIFVIFLEREGVAAVQLLCRTTHPSPDVMGETVSGPRAKGQGSSSKGCVPRKLGEVTH
jgi:hypothetical protein